MVLVPIVIIAIIIIAVTRGGDDTSIRDSILAGTYDFGASDMVTYNEYLAGFTDNDYVKNADPVKVGGKDYSDSTMSDLKVTDGYLFTGNKGKVTYNFNVKQSGLYYISVKYRPVANSTLSIVRNVYINDKIPFEEAEGVVFERLWQEENKDFLMNTNGNQAMPLEKQKEESATKNITSSDYSVAGDFAFYFKQGENTVTLESVQADMGIEEISLVPAEKLMSYQEYYAAKVAEGVPVISSGDLADPITIQAEDALVKSSPSILPQNNRSSTKTQPYHSTYIVYNTIGGESWSATGDGVTWQVEAPKEGLYKLSVRFRQALNRGFYSIREIRINGELPFQEAAEIAFPYKTDFQFEYLGDENGDYYFYLKEGTNTITMTATLASLSDAVSEVETCVRNLNELYRRLTSVMGTTPDQYRDYNILASVPDMVDIMKVEYVRLDNVIKMFGEDVNGGTKTSDLSQMMTILEKVIAKPDNITKQLTKLNDRLSALSSWMLNLGSQPLEMDYLMVCPDGYKLGKAEGGFFAKLKHSVLAFIGSYTNDYEVKSEQGEQTKQKEIRVWISTSTRSQYEIVQSLINEHFKDSPYRVKLSMVGADTLLPSTVTGNGPDVAIQVNYSMPTNFAYRNAAYDLTQFYDFEEVASEFSPGAMEYMEYNGGYYGLPDQMSFPVIFYRKDIFEQLNLSVPETWEELQELIPYLEAENMSLFMNTTNSLTLGGTSTTSNKPINPIFLSMLYQNKIDLYNQTQTKTNLGENEALYIFKYWTEFYTKQGLDYTVDLVTRFRTGQVPIVIDDYTYRNKIMVSAPEIDGQWGIAPLPGTRNANGKIDRTNTCMVGGSMIIKNTVEAKSTQQEAWDFLKWWVSAETQQNYNMELKAKDGASAEYPMANIEALKNVSIDNETKETLLATVENLRGVAQVPGGYITGRVISNVFIDVITNNEEPVDTMYLNIGEINTEIEKKRREFGLPQ